MRNLNLFICPRNKETSRSTHHGICLFSTWQAHDLSQSTSCWPLFTCLIFKGLNTKPASRHRVISGHCLDQPEANEEVKKGGSQLLLSETFSSSHPQLELSRAGSTTSAFISHHNSTSSSVKIGNNLFQYCWRPHCYIDSLKVIPTFFLNWNLLSFRLCIFE